MIMSVWFVYRLLLWDCDDRRYRYMFLNIIMKSHE